MVLPSVADVLRCYPSLPSHPPTPCQSGGVSLAFLNSFPSLKTGFSLMDLRSYLTQRNNSARRIMPWPHAMPTVLPSSLTALVSPPPPPGQHGTCTEEVRAQMVLVSALRSCQANHLPQHMHHSGISGDMLFDDVLNPSVLAPWLGYRL